MRGGGRVGCTAALGSRQAHVQLRLAAGSPGHRSPPRAPANSSVSGAVTEAALWCPPEHEMIYVQRSEQGWLTVCDQVQLLPVMSHKPRGCAVNYLNGCDGVTTTLLADKVGAGGWGGGEIAEPLSQPQCNFLISRRYTFSTGFLLHHHETAKRWV